MILKKILRNLNILNVLLLAVVSAFAVYSVFPTLQMQAKYALPSAKQVETTTGETEPHEPKIPSLAEYMSIVDENLFHPERRIPPVKVEAPPLPKPDFVLYGTMVSDDLSIAYLEDLKAPRNTPGRGKRQVALKKGDSLSGFVVKEIETDKIVMVRGEERLIVAMNDPERPRVRESVSTATTPATAQPKPQPTPTPGQSRREARAAAAAAEQTPVPHPAPAPLAIQNSVPIDITSVPSSGTGKGIKSAPQSVGSSASQVDPQTNRTPGGFLFDRLNR